MNSERLTAILFKILNRSTDFKTALGGGIYKGTFRPMDSLKDDACVNVLALTRDNPQVGIANINIYIGDISQNINGKTQNTPNYQKLENLSDIATKAISEALTADEFKDIGFTILEDKTWKNEGNNRPEHYQNLRLQFTIPKN